MLISMEGGGGAWNKQVVNAKLSIGNVLNIMSRRVIIPCSQYAKLNFNPSPKSNQKHDK